ncbi:MAG: cobalamin biosynthesis protein CobW [Ruminococcaceae bacterium]|nr:cobalamin biosynthesis protein CobW [Oscillospiraceae bacterium]
MTKIDIFSGFLGAGKTTLIKKLISEAYTGEKLVLIENEFGEIGIDGGFLKEAGIEITEMNSGCICCSLVGDFGKALKKVIDEFSPDRILIEPSGVGKLTDVIKATKEVLSDEVVLNSYTTVVDAKKCKIYHKNFGEFFNDQIKSASAVILSHTDDITEIKLDTCVGIVKELNPEAVIVTTPWKDITGKQILAAVEKTNTLSGDLEKLMEEHKHHHEHDEHCTCGCHDHEHEHHHEHDHHHEHHEHGEHCTCGCHEHEHEDHHEHEHEHHHEHGEHCTCGCHDHDHGHGHHHADDVFTSWGKETTKAFTADEINNILESFTEESKYGIILRAKGIVAGKDGQWIHFDYVPGEPDVRTGAADITGRLCVIGSKINEDAITELFGI